MKKIYHIYNCNVELPVRKLQSLLNDGMSYLDEIGLHDPEPKIESSFDTLDEAKECFKKYCWTSVSNAMGSGTKYHEVKFFELWCEIWDDGNEEDEDSDRMESIDRTGIEAYELYSENEASEKYLTKEDALEDAQSMHFIDENTEIFLKTYYNGDEIESSVLTFKEN